MKVLYLTNTMTPYRIPVLNRVHQEPGVDLTVWYLQEQEQIRSWKIDREEIQYPFECLKGIHAYIVKLDMGVHINPGIFFKLIKHAPDVVITAGYDSPGYWSALMYSKLFGKKFSVWWGSTLESSIVKNKIVNGLRRFFFGQADSFVTYGTESSRCLVHYGVKEEKIVTGYNTVDIRFFYKKYLESLQAEQPPLDDKVRLLYIGQMIPRKGLEEVIDALNRVTRTNWHLSIVGSGPLEAQLKSQVESLGLQDRITFEGYKQKEELIGYLVQADCLVFPSLREVWGLVVNEALATNTFVIASKYAGATKDIILDRQNGIIIDPLDSQNMVEGLEWVFEHHGQIKQNWRMPVSLWKKLHPYNYARAVIRSIHLAAEERTYRSEAIHHKREALR